MLRLSLKQNYCSVDAKFCSLCMWTKIISFLLKKSPSNPQRHSVRQGQHMMDHNGIPGSVICPPLVRFSKSAAGEKSFLELHLLSYHLFSNTRYCKSSLEINVGSISCLQNSTHKHQTTKCWRMTDTVHLYCNVDGNSHIIHGLSFKARLIAFTFITKKYVS